MKSEPRFRALPIERRTLVNLRDVDLPMRLEARGFDLARAASFRLTNQASLTVVPPTNAFGREALRIGTAPWLVVVENAQGRKRGQMLEVRSGRGGARYELLLRRSTGRVAAEGTAEASAEGIRFELQPTGRRRGERPVLRGSVSPSAVWTFELRGLAASREDPLG